MKEQNKRFYSTILLLVGALFVVVSGGIFVSRTWQYLPVLLKKLCVAGVTAGFFAGSVWTEKKSMLKRTPEVLYYLGVCFTGFTVISFLDTDGLGIYGCMTLAFLIMSVPVVWHYLKHRNLLDFLFQIFLTDGMVFCISRYTYLDGRRGALLAGTFLLLALGEMIYYLKKRAPEEKAMIIAGLTLYGIHVLFLFPGLLKYMMFDRNFFFGMLPTLMFTASVSMIYLSYRNAVLRTVQSISLFLCGFSFSAFAVLNICRTDSGVEAIGNVLFLGFLIGIVLTAVLERKELLLIESLMALLLSLEQISLAYGRLFLKNGSEWNGILSDLILNKPYVLGMIALLILWKVWKQHEDSESGVLEYLICWGLLGANVLLSYFWKDYSRYYGFAFWFVLALCLGAAHLRVIREARAGIYTLACAIGVGAMLSHEIIPVVFRGDGDYRVIADFSFEYKLIFLAIGIVLLGIIWYDISKNIRNVQFVMSCFLLVLLLLNNISRPALPNVLFLGITTLIMLIAAVVFRQKHYAIASAITLVLVVLYMTREIWTSIEWWVYLFAAGVGLIIFAIKREKAE